MSDHAAKPAIVPGLHPVDVRRLAASLHEEWRAGRQRTDGTYEPRWKADGSGGEVDIANRVFEELPQVWQQENLAAAEHVLQWCAEHPDSPLDDAAAAVHEAWLLRNPHATENLRVPFGELPAQEQEKDRTVVRLARLVRGAS